MNSSLFAYIWKHTKKQQIVVILLTMISFPILYMSLEIPKIIINEALSNKNQLNSFMGMEMEVIPFLVALCLSLLGLIIINGVLKMRINTLKGIIGERLVRRLRFQLVDNMLRFPLPHFSRTSQGELIATVTGEAEPLAGYISESIALPLFQGGTMLTILFFMFMQDWVFGVASVILIPVQAWLIPKLQAQVNTLKKERVKRVRKVSERIGETVSAAREIRLQGTQPYTLAEFSHWFGSLFYIRLEIFKKKFFMKFLNNTIGQITPFMFYLFGGILVIKGDITIGALVAALAAYKDLTSPWKELLNHYQVHEDSKIKYQQILEQFQPPGLLEYQSPESTQTLPTLSQPIVLNNVSWRSETGEQVLAGASARFEPGSWTAITGQNAVQRMRLAQLLVGLEEPSIGSITIGDVPLSQIDPKQLRSKLGYQGPDPFIFAGTIQDNILYGLNHNTPSWAEDQPVQQNELMEANASGNSPFPFEGNWIDYNLIHVDGHEGLVRNYLKNASVIGSDTIMYQRGLLEVFDPADFPDLAAGILEARKTLRSRIQEMGLNQVVANFDPDTYNRNATVAENILFGIPSSDSLNVRYLCCHPYFKDILSNAGIMDQALEIGARATLRLRKRVDKSHGEGNWLQQFELNDEEELKIFTEYAESYLKSPDELEESAKEQLLSIFLHLVPQQHQFGFINELIAPKLLIARNEFFLNMPDDLKSQITRFNNAEYHPKLSILDNLLFGRVVANQPALEKKITELIRVTVEEAGLKEDIMMLLTLSQAGIGGARLPIAAKHRIAAGRLIMKRPDVLIFHDALGPFDLEDKRNLRRNVRALLPDAIVIWIDREVDNVMEFDNLLKFTENGALLDVKSKPGTTDAPAEGGVAIIGQSALLGSLDAEKQQLLAEHSHKVTVKEGEWVYKSGNPSRNAYLIIKGEAQSFRNPDELEAVAGNLKPGESFGLMEIIVQRTRILSVRAKTDLEMLRVSGETLREIIDQDPTVTQTLLRALTDQWSNVSR